MMVSNNQKHDVRSIMMMMMLTITVGLLALNPSMLAQEIGAQETMTTLTISHDIDCERENFSLNVEQACVQLRFLPSFPILIFSESDPVPISVTVFRPIDVTLGAGDYRIENREAEFTIEDLLDDIEEQFPGIIITGPIDHFVGDCNRQEDFVATGFIQEGQHQTCHITSIFDIRDNSPHH